MIKCPRCGRWFKNKAALAGHQAHCVGAVSDRKVAEHYDSQIVMLKVTLEDYERLIESLKTKSKNDLYALKKRFSDEIAEAHRLVEIERTEHQKKIEEITAIQNREIKKAQLVSQKAARCVIAELFTRINTNLGLKGVVVNLPTSDLEISRYYDDIVKSMGKKA